MKENLQEYLSPRGERFTLDELVEGHRVIHLEDCPWAIRPLERIRYCVALGIRVGTYDGPPQRVRQAILNARTGVRLEEAVQLVAP